MTDVCDVSGLDAVILPSDSHPAIDGNNSSSDQGADGGEGEVEEMGGSRQAAVVSPPAIVAVSGQGLQLLVFGSC